MNNSASFVRIVVANKFHLNRARPDGNPLGRRFPRTKRMSQSIKFALRVVAVLFIVVGIIWILQGINVLPGSFMTGQIQWAYRGGIAAVVGVVLLLMTRRRR